MTRRLGLFALIFVTIAAGTIGFARVWDHRGPAPAPARPSLLTAAKDRLDFGDVWEDERFPWTVAFTNPGREEVHVDGVRTSCDCVAADPRTFTIPPGGTRHLNLTVNLTPKAGERADAPRAFRSDIALTTRTTRHAPAPETVTLTGRVRPVLNVRPQTPTFGTHSDQTTPLPPAVFAVVSVTPLECLTAVCESPGFAASAKPTDPANPSELTVTVTPTAVLPPGPLSAVVRLVPLGPGGVVLPERRVKVGGAVVRDVIADPPQVSVGGRPAGSAVEHVVTVSSLVGRAVVVQSVAARGEGLSAEQTTTGAVRVRQAVDRPGELTGRVEITAVPAGGDPVVVVVPVVGYGTGGR